MWGGGNRSYVYRRETSDEPNKTTVLEVTHPYRMSVYVRLLSGGTPVPIILRRYGGGKLIVIPLLFFIVESMYLDPTEDHICIIYM